jgi:hypothetical protein
MRISSGNYLINLDERIPNPNIFTADPISLPMKVTITSLELKSPWKFFSLSYQAMKILQQLATTKCVKKKTTGFWTSHYTMTLWENENDLKAFSKSGQHLDAMKKGGSFAKEIRILTIDATELPNWKDAKAMLKEKGRVFNYVR